MTFSFESTTDDVLDGLLHLSGRRFVITGAASGLGEEWYLRLLLTVPRS